MTVNQTQTIPFKLRLAVVKLLAEESDLDRIAAEAIFKTY